MPEFQTSVAIPNFMDAVAPAVDTSWLAKLPDVWRQGQAAQRQVDIMNAAKDSTPPGASAPDMGALTNRLMELGAFDQAGQLMQLGLRQKMLNSPGSLDDPLGRGGGTGTSAAPISAPSSGPNDYAGRVATVESSGNPNVNRAGLYQFQDSTWSNLQKLHPELGLTPDGRSDPAQQQRAFTAFTNDNASTLGRAGNPVTPSTLYLAHFAGANGANAVLAADPNTPVEQVLGHQVVVKNPFLRGATAGQLVQWAGNKMAGVGGDAGPQSVGGAPPLTVHGGQPLLGYMNQGQPAPASAAVNGVAGNGPVRVASLGPVSGLGGGAPGPAPAVSPAPSVPPAPAAAPLQPGIPQSDGTVTTNARTSQWVSPNEWAAKFDPSNPALGQKIADSLNIDPDEKIDVQDQNIRKTVVPVLIASKRGDAQPAATSDGHPYGPGSAAISYGGVPRAAGSPSPAQRPQGASAAPTAPSAQPTMPIGPGGLPAASQPPQQPNAMVAGPGAPVAAPVGGAGMPPQPAPQMAPPSPSPAPQTGPDIPGLPSAYSYPGGGPDYVRDLLTRAGQFKDGGLEGASQAAILRAKAVTDQLEAAQKARLDLQTHNAELSDEQKQFVQARQQGFTGNFMDFHGALETQKAQALAAGRNATLTPSEKQYQAAQAGGFQGSQADYESAVAGQKAEAEGQGKYLGDLPGKLSTAADAAVQTSNSVDQMLNAAQGFRMGSGATLDQGTRKFFQGVLGRMGAVSPALNSETASYEDFGKIAGVLNRQAAQQVGGRTGVQEMQLIGSTLPSPDMSYDGFRTVAANLKGTSDYQIAKAQAAQDWANDPSHNNSLRGFESAFNKNTSPAAFWLNRLQVDQPDLFAQTVKGLGQTDQGRALLQKAKAGMLWANSNGLLGK